MKNQDPRLKQLQSGWILSGLQLLRKQKIKNYDSLSCPKLKALAVTEIAELENFLDKAKWVFQKHSAGRTSPTGGR